VFDLKPERSGQKEGGTPEGGKQSDQKSTRKKWNTKGRGSTIKKERKIRDASFPQACGRKIAQHVKIAGRQGERCISRLWKSRSPEKRWTES